MKEKAAGILLLFCLIAPIIATFIFLYYQKKQVRKEIKQQIIAGIDKTELVLLKFTEEEAQTELRWKHSKEFEYDGQMYDIVEKKVKNRITYYWCLWDKKETKLNKQWDELLTYALGKDPKIKENQKRSINFYNSLFHSKENVWKSFRSQSKIKHSCLYSFNYSSVSFPPPVPPP